MSEPVPTLEGLPRTAYGEHTWLELRELARRDDIVIVIPTATLEDHGYHLPIDTDVRLIEAIARGAVERFNQRGSGRAMLFPTAVHGYTPHHLDFPGTVTLRWNVFVESLLDCGRSLCRHGFDPRGKGPGPGGSPSHGRAIPGLQPSAANASAISRASRRWIAGSRSDQARSQRAVLGVSAISRRRCSKSG